MAVNVGKTEWPYYVLGVDCHLLWVSNGLSQSAVFSPHSKGTSSQESFKNAIHTCKFFENCRWKCWGLGPVLREI